MADLNPLLLQALTASGSGQGLPLQEMLLSQLNTDDPTVALLTQMLAQRQTAPAVDEEDEADAINREEAERQEHEKSQAMAKALRHLRSKINDLYAELEELRVRNDAVAAALGACYLCWGNDLDCEVCQGKGKPGVQLPDQALFVQLIAPAIRRLQQARMSSARSSTTRAAAPDRSQS